MLPNIDPPLSRGPLGARTVFTESTPFDDAVVEEICRRLCPAVARNRHVWTLSIFTDRGDAFRNLRGKGAVDFSYGWFRHLYLEFAVQQVPMAEIYGLGDSSVYRIRRSDGTIGERVLRGTNFLAVAAAGKQYTILQLDLSPLPPLISQRRRENGIVRFHVLSQAGCFVPDVRRLTETLIHVYRQNWMTVSCNTNPVFDADSSFPVRYRFSDYLEPLPSEQNFKKQRYVGCVASGFSPGINCGSN